MDYTVLSEKVTYSGSFLDLYAWKVLYQICDSNTYILSKYRYIQGNK